MIARHSVLRPLPLRIPLALCLTLCLATLLGCRQNEEPIAAKPPGPLALVMPANGAYTGAYVDFGEGECQVTYEALTDFEEMTGKHLAVVAFGNFWGEERFPKKIMDIVTGYGAVPLLFWSPWDKPYEEMRGPDRFNLNDILAGKWDAYIDQWADDVRQYGKPLLVSWGLEMNGLWFPWSGEFYGGGSQVGEKDGKPLYAGPEIVKRAYRYVVDRVRARKADNILWGFHTNHFGLPQAAWNAMANYWPGADYVDWLGFSVYGKMQHDDDWSMLHNNMDAAYQEICQLDPDKPVIVAEWGVGEFPPNDKAEFISQGLQELKGRYPRVKAAVYWHERWENPDGSFSNLRVNSSPEALAAYRAGIADPYWIAWPQFRPRP